MRSYSNAWAEEQVTGVTSSVQGSRKAPLTQLHKSCTARRGAAAWKIQGLFVFCVPSGRCSYLTALHLVSIAHNSSMCAHAPLTLSLFFPPFFKPTTKTRSLFSKQWIESVKAHFLHGNTSASTNSSSWKPPCLSFSVQKGLHKLAALHLGCLCLLHSVSL